MIVGIRQEFYEDFTYNTDSRLLFIRQRNFIKVADDAFNVLLESRKISFHDIPLAFGFPALVQTVHRALFLFIRAGAVDDSHEQITVDDSLDRTV